MASSKSSIVFDDIFGIKKIDPEGKKFDRGMLKRNQPFTQPTYQDRTVSRLHAESRNYGMQLTLDYNHEIFPLTIGQNVVLALASSLARDSGGAQDGAIEEERDRDVWRPDGKGKRGFEDEYDYVMYGRVYRFDPGTGEVVCVPLAFHLPSILLSRLFTYNVSCDLQDCIRIIWRVAHVSDGVLPSHDEHCSWGPSIPINAKIVSGGPLPHSIALEMLVMVSAYSHLACIVYGSYRLHSCR